VDIDNYCQSGVVYQVGLYSNSHIGKWRYILCDIPVNNGPRSRARLLFVFH